MRCKSYLKSYLKLVRVIITEGGIGGGSRRDHSQALVGARGVRAPEKGSDLQQISDSDPAGPYGDAEARGEAGMILQDGGTPAAAE